MDRQWLDMLICQKAEPAIAKDHATVPGGQRWDMVWQHAAIEGTSQHSDCLATRLAPRSVPLTVK
jgi:hypothetical protein